MHYCVHMFYCFFNTVQAGSLLHQLYERLLCLAECTELPAAGFLSTGHRCFGGLKGRGAGGGRAVLGSLYSVNIAFSKSLLSVYSASLPCIYLFPSLTMRYCASHHPLLL